MDGSQRQRQRSEESNPVQIALTYGIAVAVAVAVPVSVDCSDARGVRQALVEGQQLFDMDYGFHRTSAWKAGYCVLFPVQGLHCWDVGGSMGMIR